MQIFIVEDEKPAYEILVQLIHAVNPAIKITGSASSIKEAVIALSDHKPDLIFLDIQLSDGLSFNIFKKINIDCPVIFTTAYDEYLVQAFQFNAIDYLLKPIDNKKLEEAILKYQKLKRHFTPNVDFLQNISANLDSFGKGRVLLKRGSDYIALKYSEIVCFYTHLKVTFVLSENGEKFLLNKKLSDLEEDLDKSLFFRVNRQYIINKNFIKKFKMLEKSKILLELTIPVKEEIIISQENGAEFKEWIEKA